MRVRAHVKAQLPPDGHLAGANSIHNLFVKASGNAQIQRYSTHREAAGNKQVFTIVFQSLVCPAITGTKTGGRNFGVSSFSFAPDGELRCQFIFLCPE